MQKKVFAIFSLLLVVSMMLAACGTPTAAPVVATEAPTAEVVATEAPVAGPVTIHWFIGLGAGSNPDQITKEKAFVEKFNTDQAGKFVLVADIFQNATAFDVLKTQVASGKAPDIVGPVGVKGMYSFEGGWLDLTDLIASNNYDLSDFDPALVDFYKMGPQGQIGLPFGVYPSALWYNKKIFDAAGIAYPPHKYGDQYEGADWTFDALRSIGMQMSIDANGKNATEADFDATKIVQFGYYPQWTDLRGQWTFMGAGNFVAADGVTAVVPDVWAKAAKWYYAGMWTDHFIPTQPYYSSDTFGGGNSFPTGNIAMMPQNLWFTCCPGTVDWDAAAIPSFDGGAPVAKLHADTFGILKSAKNPQASFEVLSLFIGQYSLDLAAIYGDLPARKSLQADAIAALQKTFPNVDFQVFIDGLSHPDNPNHEAGMPNFSKAIDAYVAFQTKYETKGDLDIDAELAQLVKDLQAVFDQVNAIA